MNEQAYIERFLQLFAEIRDELRAIREELGDLNATLVAVEEVRS